MQRSLPDLNEKLKFSATVDVRCAASYACRYLFIKMNVGQRMPSVIG
jgi:hypothetical protein